MKERAVLVIFGFLSVFAGAVGPGRAAAGVNINVDIGVPPPVVITRPPELVIVPGTPIYYVPDIRDDLFFYSDRWYRKHKGHWYRASYYKGPWVYVPSARVPAVFVKVPSEYRKIAYERHRVPYGQVKREWKEEKRHRKEEEKHRKHWKKHHKDRDYD